MGKGKKKDASAHFALGDSVVIAKAKASCENTISRLVSRLGCSPGDLKSGALHVVRVSGSEIEVSHRDSAGTKPAVAAKFFEKKLTTEEHAS